MYIDRYGDVFIHVDSGDYIGEGAEHTKQYNTTNLYYYIIYIANMTWELAHFVLVIE